MASDAPLAPDFIQILFSSKPKFDCYFEVGNRSQGKPERIGAVKLMLMAHSEVFRLELEDSDLKEKVDVPVEDIHPDTFKGMLKYVYGHDTTSDLCFDEADNLLYVAEKYMMKTLKNKLAARLMKLLNPDNICSLLNNPACYTHLELNSAITEILRYETDHVLASPQFLRMNVDGFLKILEQDGLAVPEIELCRAAIKWAKHRARLRRLKGGDRQALEIPGSACCVAGADVCPALPMDISSVSSGASTFGTLTANPEEDGQLLRQELSGLTQHLRLFTLTVNELCEVVTSGVLTLGEVITVCLYHCNKEKTQDLRDFSNETQPRKILQRKIVSRQLALKLSNLKSCESFGYNYNLTLLTKRNTIELLRLVCRSIDRDGMNSESWTYNVNCTVTITEVANLSNPENSSIIEPPITVIFSVNVKCGVEFEIPLAVGGRNITLLPDTMYTINMMLHGGHKQHYSGDRGSYGNDHLTLVVTRNGSYYFPSNFLQYRVATVEEPLDS